MKSCESFLRKLQFSTLIDQNAGFGGPWDMLAIFFVNAMHGFKSAILAIFQFWQHGTFELMHEIRMSQGLPNPGFRSVREED